MPGEQVGQPPESAKLEDAKKLAKQESEVITKIAGTRDGQGKYA